MKRWLFVLCVGLLPLGTAYAAPAGVFKVEVDRPVDTVYPAVYAALEDARFWVVFEADILANIARFENKWGEDFNRANLDAIRSMVVCNGWFANAVSGADPDLVALCPLCVGFYERAGRTTVVFARPTANAQGSPGIDVVAEVEAMVVKAIRLAVDRVRGD